MPRGTPWTAGDHPAPSEQDLRRAFADREAARAPLPDAPSASVAMVFHVDQDELKLCIARRATVAGDPWSGDLAFPGGRAEAGDRTAHDTAAREAFEEVGLQLPTESLIGDLGEVPLGGGGGVYSMRLYPLVYLIEEAPAPFRFDHEMVDARWISVGHLWDRQNWVLFRYGAQDRDYHGVTVMDHYLWGLSLRVLHDFSRRAERPLTPIYEDYDLPRHDGHAVAATRIG